MGIKTLLLTEEKKIELDKVLSGNFGNQGNSIVNL